MAALISERNTTQLRGDARVEPLAAAVKVWKGGLLMRNAASFVTKGATATGCIGIGRAEATVDNTADAAGRLRSNIAEAFSALPIPAGRMPLHRPISASCAISLTIRWWRKPTAPALARPPVSWTESGKAPSGFARMRR